MLIIESRDAVLPSSAMNRTYLPASRIRVTRSVNDCSASSLLWLDL
ncbi:hypothetical protein KPSA3_04360 [Pseudomonas syringae pv. actinidiae]|uniref:Uncharacterized protein n=1 Tax=Pseudomonas syringae pv. actinidiae TaxID=103796 RepID=A0AAN4TMP2_PSESF|nr:hypothetical protein KPSA3_04360 [Pseudomonas syringae pv. actinidiae]